MKFIVGYLFHAVRIAAIRALFTLDPSPDASLIIGEYVDVPAEMGRARA
jgi:hypothetical protein